MLPENDDIVVNIPEGTLIEAFDNIAFDASESSLYISAKELNVEVLEPIRDNLFRLPAAKKQST